MNKLVSITRSIPRKIIMGNTLSISSSDRQYSTETKTEINNKKYYKIGAVVVPIFLALCLLEGLGVIDVKGIY